MKFFDREKEVSIKRKKKNASIGVLKAKVEKMISGVPGLKNNKEIYNLLDMGDM